jgi:iron complex outermembrane receptor protein
VISLAALLCAGGLVQAQESGGRVSGVLTDQSGAVVPGAAIALRDIDSGVVRSTTSNAAGRYVFDSLPEGRYQVSARLPGFDPAVRDALVVRPEQTTAADLVLKVARQESVVVVTAAAMNRPLAVETDPRAPVQPVPAHDGADYLKTIPGFSVVRKGGTDGDPVLRGMAGSRLGVLLDGQQILGGCGGRMDPPTAYVFPAAYDRITVLKGPQTVVHAAGTSAGTVLFERDTEHVARPTTAMFGSFTLGDHRRNDEIATVRAAVPSFYVQAAGTRSHTDDYTDGNGAAVHSAYTRWSGNAAVGWTPDSSTLLELSVAKSDGQAAYADRGMDGRRFARDNVAIRFDRRTTWSAVRRVEVQSYYNYIDHVMDNFDLRTPGTMFMVNNPDRATFGGRAAVTLSFDNLTSVVAGADLQRNIHTFRGASAKSATAANDAYVAAPRAQDMRFRQVGLFAEGTRFVTARNRVIAGVRSDWHEAVDSRPCVGATTCAGTSPFTNDTLGAHDRRRLTSAFGRYERDVTRGGAGTFYVGLGHAERSPDFWERAKQDPVTLKSAFLSTRPEKTTQVDTGMTWKSRAWSGSLSAFYGRLTDYVLIRWKPTPAVARNVEATTMGGEADLERSFTGNLKAVATFSYVRSTNDTDHKPLAQQPPAEGRLRLQYDNRAFSIGALARVVAAQNRVDVGSGNIVSNGMDLGPTGGFSVFSINGGHRLRKGLVLTAGIDNLTSRVYAEHISQGGASVPGFVATTRVNEPGRTFWLKANVDIR